MEFQGDTMAPRFDSARRPAIDSAGRVVMAEPPDRTHAFKAARRRSGRVRFLRRAILGGVLAVVAAMVAIVVFNPFASKISGISFSSLGVDGSKVMIVKPRLSGYRSDGQPYSLTAEQAVQDMKQPTRVELHKLTGEIGLTGGEATHIAADSGVYDSTSEKMRLKDNIRIGNSRLDIRLRSAEIDFKSGVYPSAEPVEIHAGDTTTIRADRAEARDNGQQLVFDGRVRTTIVPQSAEDDTKGTKP